MRDLGCYSDDTTFLVCSDMQFRTRIINKNAVEIRIGLERAPENLYPLISNILLIQK